MAPKPTCSGARIRRVLAGWRPSGGRVLASVAAASMAMAGLLGGAAAPASASAHVPVGPAAAGASAATGAPADSLAPGPAVQNLAATGADRAALAEAYASARHLPGSAVAGIRPGSLHVARVTATGVRWATASFAPSPAAGLVGRIGFQDGAAAGVFSQSPGQPWHLAQPSAGPAACDPALPPAVRAAWHLAQPAGCGTPVPVQQRAATTARSAVASAPGVGPAIARIALSQVGVGDTPAIHSFSGVNCDPYTTLVGAVTPNSDGCGYDPTFKVENENEEWCSDFAKWVWEQAGVTADMNTINAGAVSFYVWGLGQDETIPVDSASPQVGDAVVFFPPGAVSPNGFADHVGLVTAVNPDGTVDLVNGDFLGTSNSRVEYDTNVHLSTWASQTWNAGEQWVFVAPPATAQHPVPHATASGPRVAVTGTAVSFTATASEPGGSISQYLWTFGGPGSPAGRSATATGPSVSHVFPNAGLQTVTMAATSSFGTVTTRTWNVDVVSPSSAVTSTAGNQVWYSTIPVSQDLYLRSASGGLADESWDGASWLRQDLPGTLGPAGQPTALNYADATGALEPQIFFRSAGGQLTQTYRASGTWATQSLPGDPAPGSTIVATTTADAPQLPAAEVFYIDQSGHPAETYQQAGGWVSRTLPGPATGRTALALTEEARGGTVCVRLYYVGRAGSLAATSAGGCGPALPLGGSGVRVAPSSSLAAVSTGSGPDEQNVFFTDSHGRLAEAVPGPLGLPWAIRELPGTPTGTLAAVSYLTPSGTPAPEVFYRNAAGQPAVTYASGPGAWASTTLPGVATDVLGAAAFPADSQPQRVYLADGAQVTADSAAAPAGPWTAATLPARAATLADRVLLYAATTADEQAALAAARSAGLPASQVTESFATAWADTLTGGYLVIAVGQAAIDALYFNACGWPNPSGSIPGSTPFYFSGAPLNTLPGADAYENGAAATPAQTPQRAADLAYYALHGHLPAGVTALPAAAHPRAVCAGQPAP